MSVCASVQVGMNRMLCVSCLRLKFKRKNGNAIPQKMNEKSLFQCCLIWNHCSSCCWSLYITFILIRTFFSSVFIFIWFYSAGLSRLRVNWRYEMQRSLLKKSIILIERDVLNSYFDFLVINVNIICKDILLYIFVKCFLKAKFNKKRTYIYIWIVLEEHCHSYWIFSVSDFYWNHTRSKWSFGLNTNLCHINYNTKYSLHSNVLIMRTESKLFFAEILHNFFWTRIQFCD